MAIVSAPHHCCPLNANRSHLARSQAFNITSIMRRRAHPDHRAHAAAAQHQDQTGAGTARDRHRPDWGGGHPDTDRGPRRRSPIRITLVNFSWAVLVQSGAGPDRQIFPRRGGCNLGSCAPAASGGMLRRMDDWSGLIGYAPPVRSRARLVRFAGGSAKRGPALRKRLSDPERRRLWRKVWAK